MDFTTEEMVELRERLEELLIDRADPADFLDIYEPVKERLTRFLTGRYAHTVSELVSLIADCEQPQAYEQALALLARAKPLALRGIRRIEEFLDSCDGERLDETGRLGLDDLDRANSCLILAMDAMEAEVLAQTALAHGDVL